MKNACAGWVFHFVGGKARFWERSGGYVSKIVTQHTAKWGGQNGAIIFQTHSRQLKEHKKVRKVIKLKTSTAKSNYTDIFFYV